MIFSEIFDQRNKVGFGVKIFREFYVPDSWGVWEIGDQDLGMYWSWDKEAALSHWSRFGWIISDTRWFMESFARSDQIDWNLTAHLDKNQRRMQVKEIKVLDGSDIPVVLIKRIPPEASMGFLLEEGLK